MTTASDREAFDEAVAAGSDHLKQGDLAEAQRQFRIALDHEPDNMRVLALLGLTYFRGNQFDEARPIYERLAERAPTDASHRLNLGLVFLKLNAADHAINALEASRALDPGQGRAVSYLGLAYARAGRYTEAYRAFLLANQNELAIEIELNLTDAERAGIHAQLGRTPHGPFVASTPTGDAPVVGRTPTPEPRTKPPSAPPKARASADDEHAASEAFHNQLSHPEIVIERDALASGVPMVPARSGASVVDGPRPAASPSPSPWPSVAPDARPMTESMQFVLPKSTTPQPLAGVSMISQAVAAAAPTTTSGPERTKAGGLAPRPLSELATDPLIRPDDGDDVFEITDAGELVVRISDRVMMRLQGVHLTGGDLAYEPATRRSRGHQTEERFDYGGVPLHVVSGSGYLIALPGDSTFDAVALDDDILYLREDLVFAFETSLRWESGNVPGMRGKLPVVQFRGDGALALKTARPLVRVKLPASGVVFVDAERLAGWIGRVIPRAVVPPTGGPMGTTCVECTGEGIILLEPAPVVTAATMIAAALTNAADAPSAPTRATPPPPPPAAAAEPAEPPAYDPELDMSSVTAAFDEPLDPPSED